MKSIIAFLVMAPSLLGTPAVAARPLADTVIVSSSDTVVAKRQVKYWNDTIDDLYRKLEEKDGQMQTLNEAAKDKKEVEKQRDQIQKDRDRVQKDKDKLQKDFDVLKNKYEALKKSDLEKQIDQLLAEVKAGEDKLVQANNALQASKDEVAALNEQLTRLGTVKEAWFSQLVASAETDWLTRPFAQIDPMALRMAKAPYEEFGSDNADVRVAGEKLQVLLDDLKTYQDARGLLENPYDKAAAQSYLDLALSAVSKDACTLRKDEWAAVIDGLENYGARVEMCQDLVKSIEESLVGKAASRWKTVIENTIQEEEDSFGTKTAIDSIPWLKQQFEGYCEIAKTLGPNLQNQFRDAILNVAVK